MFLIKTEAQITVCDNYFEKIDELLFKVIMLDSDEDEKIIIDKYYELLNKYKRLPYLSDLSEYIDEYNEDIFWKVAQIQFYNEFDITEYQNINLIDDKIDDLAWGWLEYCGYYYSNMKLKLEVLLRKNRLCTVCCIDDEIIEIDNLWDHNGAEFLIANCQNTLLDKIIDDNCAGFDDYLIYYNPDFKE